MADVTIDEKELAALRLAAKFLADHGDSISHQNQYALDILKIDCPNATLEAAMDTREASMQLTQDLDKVADALAGIGMDMRV